VVGGQNVLPFTISETATKKFFFYETDWNV